MSGSLVGAVSRFIITTIAGEGSAETEAILLTETCQKVDLQNQCKQAHEGQISNMTEVQAAYKLALNPESIVFIERPDETASYQYSFEDNRR
jgi:hypothetical protein